MEISEITMNEAEWQLLMIRLREFANYIDLIQQFIKQDVNNNWLALSEHYLSMSVLLSYMAFKTLKL